MNIFDLEIENLSFKNKKIPISADMRPLYRITRLMLVLKFSSRSSTSSLMKLYLFDWAFQDTNRYVQIEYMLQHKRFPVIKFDPFVIRALNYGIALELISLHPNTQKMKLTNKGEEWLLQVIELALFKEEIKFLKIVGKSITESKISELSRERYQL